MGSHAVVLVKTSLLMYQLLGSTLGMMLTKQPQLGCFFFLVVRTDRHDFGILIILWEHICTQKFQFKNPKLELGPVHTKSPMIVASDATIA